MIRFTDEQKMQIISLYHEGYSARAIVEELGGGLRYQTILRRLHEWGVEVREPGASGSGPDHPRWVGPRPEGSTGYMIVRVYPGDPMESMVMSNGYVLEHRLVMARHLGRPLTKDESVHHIDGDRANNKIENLQLRQRHHGIGVKMQCNKCGSMDVSAIEL